MSVQDPEGELAQFKAAIERFAENQLGEYTDRISKSSVPKAAKEFSDPVWATIYLTPIEIVLVDSPLFQRLRLIRQLGVVHWVYPGALHTRFDHSLGTLYQMQELIDSINRDGNSESVVRISDDDARLLRLTALCHDLGHGVMSHVSENAFRSIGLVSELTLQFTDLLGVSEKARLSEMAAFYIVGSPAFRSMIGRAKDATDERHLAPDAVDKIQKAIVGEIITNKVPLMQELISGPFDADKLDYMQRDAMMAGVPTVTDVPRLVRKIRAITVSQEGLPEELKTKVSGGEDFYVIFGIAYSGSRTLDELLFGRILLFDKLYRHQKVRAIEGMVSILLFTLRSLFKGSAYLLPFTLHDDQLLNIDITLAYNELFDLTGTDRGRWFEIACELSRFLRTRRLYVRAFAFAKNMPGDPYRNSPEQVVGADKLLRAANPAKKHVLAQSVAQETLQILKVLGHERAVESFADDTLLSYIYIDPPEAPGNAGKIPQAYLLGENKRISRFREASSEMRSWADAYLFAKDIGYIFCPAELKQYVFLAAEIVVRRDFNIRTPLAVFDYVKEEKDITRELKTQLLSKGYYSNLPHDIRPKAARLGQADIPSVFSKIRAMLQGYSGPFASPDDHALSPPYLTDRHIEDWLQQFESEEFISSAIKMLEHLGFIGRKEIVGSLMAFLDRNAEFRAAMVSPLGEARDSGPTTAYFCADINTLRVLDLVDGLSEQPARIILVDDFIGSGHQAITIVESLLGLSVSYPLAERRRRRLPVELQTALKEAQLCFLFAAGWSAGADELRKACDHYGLNARVEIGITDEGLPDIFDDRLYDNNGQKNAFLDKCRAIGRDILLEPKIGHDESWLADKTLGYGDRGLLITFPYNTPTQSLACLWKSGSHQGIPWIPLLPRRKKK